MSEMSLPQKTYFPVRNQAKLNHRKEQLAKYMQELGNKSEIINSRPFIKFIRLNKEAPEALVNQPTQIERIRCNATANEQFYVTHCKMVEIEGHQIFFVCLADAKKKNASKLEVHTFKYLSPLNETYG